MGQVLPLFVAFLPLLSSRSLLVGCLTNNASSTPPVIPASSTSFSPMPPVPTPLLRPLPQANLMVSLPGSSSTVQATRPTQQPVSISCPADVKMISPAHAQLISATALPNLRPTAQTASFRSACHPVMNNASGRLAQ